MMKSLFCAVAACMSLSAAAADDNYPTRPVRLLVPFAPGGGADALSRIITPKMHDALGQAGWWTIAAALRGNIAAETVAKAAPDGYTALMGLSPVLTVNPSLYKLPYSVTKDLQPVTLLATAQYILVIHPSVAATNLKDFIALAKQKPGSLNYASAGVGSPSIWRRSSSRTAPASIWRIAILRGADLRQLRYWQAKRKCCLPALLHRYPGQSR